MRSRSVKAALAAVVAAVAMLPAPAGAEVAPAPCNAIAVGDSVGTHVVQGTATAPGATSLTLRCGIVQNGTVVASFYASMPGAVAAGVWVTRIEPGSYTVCADIHATFLDGTYVYVRRCP